MWLTYYCLMPGCKRACKYRSSACPSLPACEVKSVAFGAGMGRHMGFILLGFVFEMLTTSSRRRKHLLEFVTPGSEVQLRVLGLCMFMMHIHADKILIGIR